MSLEERVKLRCIECGDCWIWQGSAGGSRRKNPQISIGGKKQYVRRALYEEKHGRIPEGKQLTVTCESPMCVNPAHTVAKTASQICQEVADTGIYSNPARCAKIAAFKQATVGKLDAEAVRRIRECDEPAPRLATELGVDPSLVCRVRRGETWKEYGANPFAGLMA